MQNNYYLDQKELSGSRARRILGMLLLLFAALVVCTSLSVLVPGGLGFLAGYMELQTQNHENAIQHFERGLGYLAENYPELAHAEFEISIRYDPAYDPARQKLQEMEAVLGTGATGTPEENRVAAALYDEARDLIANKGWNDAINRLEQLRALNVNFRNQEVSDLLFQTYVASGKEAVAARQFELARERFDSALTIRNGDPEVQHQRDLAELYLDGQQAVGYNWQVAITKFSTLYQQDPNYDDVKQRLVDAYTQYGDLAMRQNASCLAVREYDGALAISKEASISDKRAQAMAVCRQAIVATPTPVVAPGTGTPSGAATGTETYVAKVTRDNGRLCNTGTGDVGGVVRDALGQPLASVWVAYYADGINRVSMRTNINGQYQFTWGTEPGSFHIIVLSADAKTPAGAAADVEYPGGNKPGCHIVVDWQRMQ